MRVILTGATGAAGLAIYRAALNDPAIQHVTLLTRRAIPSWAKLPLNASDKTDVVLHSDFKQYDSELARRLAVHDALIWALGKSAAGMSEEAYTELTYEYTLAAARALKDAGAGSSSEKPFRFVYLSTEYADPTGLSWQMWARVKGRVERELPELFKGTNIESHVFRPGYFFPSKDYPEDRLNQRGAAARVAHIFMSPMLRYLMPSGYTPIDVVGKFAVGLAKGQWPQQQMYRSVEMKRLTRTLDSA